MDYMDPDVLCPQKLNLSLSLSPLSLSLSLLLILAQKTITTTEYVIWD